MHETEKLIIKILLFMLGICTKYVTKNNKNEIKYAWKRKS